MNPHSNISSMTIQEDFTELQNIHIELKRLRSTTRTLNIQRKQCEDRIIEYLRAHNHPGMRMGNTVVTVEPRQKSKRVSHSYKQMRCEQILSQYGVQVSDVVVKEFLGALKGSPQQQEVLKIKQV